MSDEWIHDMEAAPKDGTEILVWASSFDTPGYCIAAWDNETRGPGVSGSIDKPGWYGRACGRFIDDEGWDTGNGFILSIKPTAWRPLPSPPGA